MDPAQLSGDIRIMDVADGALRYCPYGTGNGSPYGDPLGCGREKPVCARTSGSSVALISLDANGNPRVMHEIPIGAAWISFIVPSQMENGWRSPRGCT